jgi:ATP-binding cassette subfamily B (MDR/TAP) protein 1
VDYNIDSNSVYDTIYLAVGVCWTRTAERQTSRMRIEYLKSILRQEVGFFDKQSNSSTTFQVIATITSDAQTIQDTLSDKVHIF